MWRLARFLYQLVRVRQKSYLKAAGVLPMHVSTREPIVRTRHGATKQTRAVFQRAWKGKPTRYAMFT